MVRVRIIAIIFMIALGSCVSNRVPDSLAPGLKFKNAYTLVPAKNYVTGYDSADREGRIQAVVEIPAGTLDKWEVRKEDGFLHRDFKDGKPRTVNYLPYPVNYGMIPGTLLGEELGGDHDPLDVLLIAPAYPRGTVVKVRLIGLIRLTDKGSRDDKLIAIPSQKPLTGVERLEDLDEKYPGITRILELWFVNYKGPGKLEFKGFGGPEEAMDLLRKCQASYRVWRNQQAN